jgi:hypothetical protein
MAGVGPISQDWEPVVIRKKAPNAAAKKDEKAVNAARRTGGPIETIKKCNSNPNPLHSFSYPLTLLFHLHIDQFLLRVFSCSFSGFFIFLLTATVLYSDLYGGLFVGI